MSEDIDCQFTSQIVCPHCGNVHMDSWELFRHEVKEVVDLCEQCGRTFIATINYKITYSTRKGQ